MTYVVHTTEDALLITTARGALCVKSAKRGCRDGSCGSCRVLLDGALVSSCLVRMGDVADGATLEAYEDVAREEPARRALAQFEDERPTRCDLCVGGLAVTAVSLARRGLARDEAAIDAVLEGAHCQCTGRGSLRRALRRA